MISARVGKYGIGMCVNMMYRLREFNIEFIGGALLRHLLLLFGVVLLGCNSRFDAASTSGVVEDVVANISIEQLHSLLGSGEYVDIDEELVIRGCVTANDVGGNFYRSFMIEQDGWGVEIMEGLTYSYARYGEGYVIGVKLNGLRMARSRGVLQVGVEAAAGSYYMVDYLGHEFIVDKHIVNTGIVEPVEPMVLTLEGLYESDERLELMARLCGTLVTIEGVNYLSDGESDVAMWGGSSTFVDDVGYEVISYTSSYANYSACEIPTEEVSLTGIVQSDDGDLMIKMRCEDDCKLLE